MKAGRFLTGMVLPVLLLAGVCLAQAKQRSFQE